MDKKIKQLQTEEKELFAKFAKWKFEQTKGRKEIPFAERQYRLYESVFELMRSSSNFEVEAFHIASNPDYKKWSHRSVNGSRSVAVDCLENNFTYVDHPDKKLTYYAHIGDQLKEDKTMGLCEDGMIRASFYEEDITEWNQKKLGKGFFGDNLPIKIDIVYRKEHEPIDTIVKLMSASGHDELKIQARKNSYEKRVAEMTSRNLVTPVSRTAAMLNTVKRLGEYLIEK